MLKTLLTHSRNFGFFKGYLLGMATMLVLPQRWFQQLAVVYYDLAEPEESLQQKHSRQ